MLSESYVTELAMRALEEDVGRGDVTSAFIGADSGLYSALVVVHGNAVLSGGRLAEEVFRQAGAAHVEVFHKDGDSVCPADRIMAVEGPARALLAGERVALNFLQHLSGVATRTDAFVTALEGLPTRIVDTRKTVPGLRLAQKAAVRHGGGSNHRFGLDDGILVKDNHLAVAGKLGMSVKDVVAGLHRATHHLLRIEVEIDRLDMLEPTIEAGVDAILLDNMSIDVMRDAVRLVRKGAADRILIEASGNITLETVREVAETGVDLIAVGELTHTVAAVDFNMEIER